MDIKNEIEVKTSVESMMKDGFKVDKNTAELLEILVQLIDGIVENQKNFIILFKSIFFAINFIVSILICFLFLRIPFGEVVYKILPTWGSFSEAWKIAIFTLIMSIPCAVIAGVILKLINIFWFDNLKKPKTLTSLS